jgi:cytochrome c oxidase subunit 3
MVVFLGSWAMMFAAIFFAYAALRLRSPSWPPFGAIPLPLAIPTLNTLVLLASSGTLHLALRALRRHDIDLFRWWSLATLTLGTAFLALQLLVWLDLWESGLQLRSGVYGSIFYVMTAFHALHVVVGLGFLIWLTAPALRRNARPFGTVPVKLASMFWHFVDVVWVLMFLAVYVA